MKKPVILITNPESLGELSALQKAHVKGYTRGDGTFVKEHDTSVTAKPKAASPSANKFPGEKNGPSDASLKQFAQTDPKAKAKLDKQEADKKYGHPNVVGHAENLKGGDASKAHGMHFAGKEYIASGKEGKSMHDDTPVRHFTELTGTGDDDGEHVWMDHSGRVHADDTSSVKRLRGEYEAHAGKADQKPAGGAAKPKHSAATLSALADQHEAESERQDKLATKKGANHPDYEKHVIASAHHAKAQRHAEKARDAKDEGERDAHLEAHARYKALAEKAEASVGDAPAEKPASAKKRAASKPLHHSDLKEGDELIGPDGEKHEYSHTTRGLGRMKIETRAGYSHPAEKDGTLPGWKKTGRNNMTGEGH